MNKWHHYNKEDVSFTYLWTTITMICASVLHQFLAYCRPLSVSFGLQWFYRNNVANLNEMSQKCLLKSVVDMVIHLPILLKISFKNWSKKIKFINCMWYQFGWSFTKCQRWIVFFLFFLYILFMAIVLMISILTSLILNLAGPPFHDFALSDIIGSVS